MSDEQCRQLFQPFTQADASMVRRFGGTGLGLSMTRKILDLHEGRITVGSGPGGGATFTVFLPRSKA